MLVKLTQMYFDGRFRHRAGAVIDLPAERVPKSAVPVAAATEPEAPPPTVKSQFVVALRRWRVSAGGRTIEEFTEKGPAHELEEQLKRDPEALRERLTALDAADQETGDAVS